ncbi:sensor histidine kinase, partial [Enterococcus cecorum]|nr:sensor histidine kinase [Enterococcus cecorum]
PAIDNIRAYLNMSASDYFSYTQDSWLAYKRDTRISETVPVFFSAFNDLDKVYVKLEESSKYLVADKSNPMGRKEYGQIPHEQGFVMKKSIISPFGFEHVGELSVVFSQKSVLGTFEHMMELNGMEAASYTNLTRRTT